MKNDKNQNMWCGRGAGDAVYGLGLFGALVYFMQHAPTFSDKLLAVVKTLIWPALAVYSLLSFLRV